MSRFSSVCRIFIASAVTACLGTTAAVGQSATQPAPVVASSVTTVGTGLVQPHAVARNNAGNLFVANSGATTLVEVSPTTGAQTVLIPATAGLSYPEGVTTDPSGNAYISDFSGYIWVAPASGAAFSKFYTSSAGSCAASLGYYFGVYGLASDGASNIYAIGNNEADVIKLDQAGNCTVLLTPSTFPSGSIPTFIASDAAGNLYISVGTALYSLPVGATAPTKINVNFAAINGLSVDAAGNLYIADNASLDEIPFTGGALSPSGLTYLTAQPPAGNFAVAPNGMIYAVSGSSLTATAIDSVALGQTSTATPGSPAQITYVFNAAETPAAFNVVSGNAPSAEFSVSTGSSCAVGTAYSASTSGATSSCTLNVALTAAGVGKRSAAVELVTRAGVVSTTYLNGTGLGAGLTVDPGTQTKLGSFTAPSTPSAVRVDGAGNVFIADSTGNKVTEISATGAIITVGSGLNAPGGLAVDPAGNVFIADTGNNRVVEVPSVNGTLSTAAQTVVPVTVNGPQGLALDLYGDLLIANTGAGNVIELPGRGGVFGNLASFNVGSGFSKPVAIAVDANNDIFVADAGSADVIEISSVLAQSTAVSGLAMPQSVAVDAAGDLFLTQAGVPTVTRVPFTGGTYSTNATTSLGVGLVGPQGIALDSQGNLYVADAAAAAAYKITRTLGALNFGSVNALTTGAAQNLELSNSGNQSLAIASPFYTATGNTADFTLVAPASNGCGTALATGASCALSANFTPLIVGSLAEQVTFQTNAANASGIGANLTGTGANLFASSLALTLVSPTGAISFGTPIVVSAQVTSSGSSLAPTGTVQFTVDGTPYGQPVPLTTGAATEMFSKIGPGSHVINATYSGDTNYASASATMAFNVTIGTAFTTTTLAANITSSVAIATGSSATFTATVAPSTTLAVPSGTVTFIANGTTLGTVALAPNGQAVLTTTTLPNGQYTVTAMYSGDTVFTASTSAPYPVYVSAPTFTVSGLPSSLSVPTVGAATASFTVAPVAGFVGAVSMVCNNLPANAVCIFSPASVDFVSSPVPETVQLTIQTGVAPPTINVAGFIGLTGLFSVGTLVGLSRRRRTVRFLPVALLALAGLVSASAISGCGVGLVKATPAGTANVTVVFTGTPGITSSSSGTFVSSGSNVTQSEPLSLQVQ